MTVMCLRCVDIFDAGLHNFLFCLADQLGYMCNAAQAIVPEVTMWFYQLTGLDS